jgi:hypothetical protein
MLRYLRIAAAVFFALLAIGFVALWVRSYTHKEHLMGMVTEERFIAFHTHWGYLEFSTHVEGSPKTASELPFKLYSKRVPHPIITYVHPDMPLLRRLQFIYASDERSGFAFGAPYWFYTLIAGLAAVLLGIKLRWRFTVRGLLIATTLIAATLGLVAYSLR